MQRCVESLETYFILGQKSSPLSLAINYIYLYRLEQVHVQDRRLTFFLFHALGPYRGQALTGAWYVGSGSSLA